MRLYTVHLRRPAIVDADMVLVKEGFSWPALLFSGLWALWHRMWLAAAVIFAAPALAAGLLAGAGPAPQAVASGLLGLGLGLFGNDIRRWHLQVRGYADEGAVRGGSLSDAERRFLEGRPEIGRGLAGPAAAEAVP